MVTLRPLQICTTTECHDHQAVCKAAFLNQEGEFLISKVVRFPLGRVKIKFDAPEQPGRSRNSVEPLVGLEGMNLPSPSDVEYRRGSD